MRISDWSSDVCSSDLANTKIVRHRNAGGPGNIPGIIVAISCLNLAFEIVRDILADDADCAACCIAAIEDALRSLEDLDAFDVVKFECAGIRAADIAIVDIDRHTWLEARQDEARANAPSTANGR